MILFSSDALSDIERVRNFLEIRNPQAAVRAMRTIWAALGRVETMPYIGEPTKDRIFGKSSFASAGAAISCAIEFCRRMTRYSSRASGMVARRANDARHAELLENWHHAQTDGRCFRIAGPND